MPPGTTRPLAGRPPAGMGGAWVPGGGRHRNRVMVRASSTTPVSRSSTGTPTVPAKKWTTVAGRNMTTPMIPTTAKARRRPVVPAASNPAALASPNTRPAPSQRTAVACAPCNTTTAPATSATTGGGSRARQPPSTHRTPTAQMLSPTAASLPPVTATPAPAATASPARQASCCSGRGRRHHNTLAWMAVTSPASRATASPSRSSMSVPTRAARKATAAEDPSHSTPRSRHSAGAACSGTSAPAAHRATAANPTSDSRAQRARSGQNRAASSPAPTTARVPPR